MKPFILWSLRAPAKGEGSFDQGIELSIDLDQSPRKAWLGCGHTLRIEGDESRAEDSGIEAREETSDFPAVGRHDVAVSARRSEEQALAAEPPQIVAGLAGTVRLLAELRDTAPEVLIAEAVDQVSKEGEGSIKAITRGSPKRRPGAL